MANCEGILSVFDETLIKDNTCPKKTTLAASLKRRQWGLGVPKTYTNNIDTNKYVTYTECYLIAYPTGINIFPIGYSLFPIGYSLRPGPADRE